LTIDMTDAAILASARAPRVQIEPEDRSRSVEVNMVAYY
jgi:hypothetical protein